MRIIINIDAGMGTIGGLTKEQREQEVVKLVEEHLNQAEHFNVVKEEGFTYPDFLVFTASV